MSSIYVIYIQELFLLFSAYFITGLYSYIFISGLSSIIHNNYSGRPNDAPSVPINLEYYIAPYLSVWGRFDSVENTAYL